MVSLKNIFKKSKSVSAERSGEWHPNRDWKILLSMFIVINIGVAAATLYMFYKIQAGEFFKVSLEREEVGRTINRKLLEETIERFDSRSERLPEASGSPGAFDPSL